MMGIFRRLSILWRGCWLRENNVLQEGLLVKGVKGIKQKWQSKMASIVPGRKNGGHFRFVDFVMPV